MFCTECGKQIVDTARFCSFCGVPVMNVVVRQPQAVAPAPAPAPVQQPAVTETPVQEAPAAEAPVNEAPAAEAAVDPTVTEAPVAEPEATEVPVTETEAAVEEAAGVPTESGSTVTDAPSESPSAAQTYAQGVPQNMTQNIPQNIPQNAAVTAPPAVQMPAEPKPERKYTLGHIMLCLATVAVMAITAGVFAGLYFSVV